MPPLLPTEQVDLWPSAWGGLRAGTQTQTVTPLFPRFDESQERSVLERLGIEVAPTEKKKAPTMTETERGKDDFIEVDRLSRIHYDGKFFDYPLRPANALKNLGVFTATST